MPARSVNRWSGLSVAYPNCSNGPRKLARRQRHAYAAASFLIFLITGCGLGGTLYVPAPEFTPSSGTFPSAISVTLTDVLGGAEIHYTTNGSTPSDASLLYSGPISVTATETIRAIATARGFTSSSVVSGTYVIEVPADTPTFSPPPASYATPISVTILDTTPGAIIHYTTDGSTPTTGSNIYVSPISVTSSEVIEALAEAPGYDPSAVAIGSYTITSPHHSWTCIEGCKSGATGFGPGSVGSIVNLGVLQAVSWTDHNDNLWLFGGRADNTKSAYYNSLWEYLPALDEWLEITGAAQDNAPGVYGVLGVPSPTNTPGARVAAYTWTDANGNLWLFGGEGYDANGAEGLLNDLWKFDIATQLWTWMGGSITTGASGNYGERATQAAANQPGARHQGVSWTDAGGNFWLFGAEGVDANGVQGNLNDLWQFSPTTGLWSWMSGSTVAGAPAAFDSLGAPSALNMPGGFLGGSTSAIDQAGNFRFFGGTGFTAITTNSLLNDLWQFNPITAKWTWVAGSTQGGDSGTYGTLNVPAAANMPGARQFGVGGTDLAGNLFTFGGYGVDSTGKTGMLNDLWEFSTQANQWVWSGGSSVISSTGTPGTRGYPSVDNVPGAREYAVSWVDQEGNLWLFAGYGYDLSGNLTNLGDLWRFTP